MITWTACLGDVAVGVEADGPSAPLLQRLLPTATGAGPEPELRLIVERGDEQPPAGPPERRLSTGAAWLGPPLVLHDNGSGWTGRAQGGEARLVAPSLAADPTCLLLYALVLTTALLAPGGRHLLHAAAFTRDGRTVLAVGPTGAGKSTLTYAASQAGWTVLGDDLVTLQSTGRQLLVRGIHRVPSVPGDQHPLDGEAMHDPRGRFRLTGLPLSAGAHPVTDVVVVGHSAGAAALRPAQDTARLRPLLSCSTSTLDLTGPHTVLPVLAQLCRLRGWDLLHAHDAGARGPEAQRLLDRLLHDPLPPEVRQEG